MNVDIYSWPIACLPPFPCYFPGFLPLSSSVFPCHFLLLSFSSFPSISTSLLSLFPPPTPFASFSSSCFSSSSSSSLSSSPSSSLAFSFFPSLASLWSSPTLFFFCFPPHLSYLILLHRKISSTSKRPCLCLNSSVCCDLSLKTLTSHSLDFLLFIPLPLAKPWLAPQSLCIPSRGDRYKERDTSRQYLQNILKVKLLFETKK